MRYMCNCIARPDISDGVYHPRKSRSCDSKSRCVVSTDERASTFVTDGYLQCAMAMHLFIRF